MKTERLNKLCSTFAVSSAENNIAKLLKEEIEKMGYETKRDNLGSILAYKKSKNENAKTLMIACPLDEVGLMISNKDENNHLSFIELEHVGLSSLLHQRVEVLTRDNEKVIGVITTKAKALEDKCAIDKIEDLYIKCTDSTNIKVGDLASYAPNFMDLENKVISKALFPRVLNEVVLSLLYEIKDLEFDYNIVVACISQSIIGYRGSKTATYVVQPDSAIALTCFQNDIKEDNTKLYVGYYDRQMLPSKEFLNDIETNISCKPYFGMMGNDGSFIHKTLSGTPTVSLGISVENLGSANELCSKEDINLLISSLLTYLKSLNNEKIGSFSYGR